MTRSSSSGGVVRGAEGGKEVGGAGSRSTGLRLPRSLDSRRTSGTPDAPAAAAARCVRPGFDGGTTVGGIRGNPCSPVCSAS